VLQTERQCKRAGAGCDNRGASRDTMTRVSGQLPDDVRTGRGEARPDGSGKVDFVSENAVAQGVVLASLIAGFALAVIGQLVSAFPGDGDDAGGPVGAAVTRFALAATVMMVNVWTGIIFFLDDGGDRTAIAAVFYAGLFAGVVIAALGMVEMVSIRSRRLRRPILTMFVAVLAAEAVLGLAFLR
jgi:hypothetical protein